MKGYQEFAALIALWNASVLLWLFLSGTFGLPKRYMWIMVLVVPFVIACLYVYGRLYYKYGFYSEENRWYSHTNEAYWQMLKAIERSKEHEDKRD